MNHNKTVAVTFRKDIRLFCMQTAMQRIRQNRNPTTQCPDDDGQLVFVWNRVLVSYADSARKVTGFMDPVVG